MIRQVLREINFFLLWPAVATLKEGGNAANLANTVKNAFSNISIAFQLLARHRRCYLDRQQKGFVVKLFGFSWRRWNSVNV